MKKTRAFRLSNSTISMLEELKDIYNSNQFRQENNSLNLRSFSTATVIEKLIQKEYESLKGEQL